MKTGSKTLWIVLGIVVLIALYAWTSYNGLVGAKANVDNSWAQVQTQYQRRFDLVPNLVRTVQGAAQFEQETLQNITAARSSWQRAASRTDQIAAADQFESSLSRLLVTVESYPQLKATQAFQDLMTQLEGTENRISESRRDYNNAVTEYNVTVRSFPRNMVAGLFGFSPENLFEAAEGSDVAPTVDFGTTSAMSSAMSL